MAKYFCVSDIHSYATYLTAALGKAGFNVDNNDHILIICGDIFDRGYQTLECYNYIMSIPKHRRILIRGNHELLFLELLDSDLPGRHDYSNGTVRTFCHIAGVKESYVNPLDIELDLYAQNQTKINNEQIEKILKARWAEVKQKVLDSDICAWIKSDEWRAFYELDNLIFVHSFIPTQVKEISETKLFRYYPPSQLPVEFIETVPNWRECKYTSTAWEDATWGCPYKQFDAGLFDGEIAKGNILVCGHWHTSDFHARYENDLSNNLNLYFGKNLIALDACTAASQFCNVLLYDSDSKKFYDKFGEELIAR